MNLKKNISYTQNNMPMKKLKILLLALCPLMMAQAQTTLFVKAKTGTNNAFSLSTVKMLTFAGGNVIVNKTDASTSTFLCADLRNINFGATSNGIAETLRQSSGTLKLFPNPAIDVLNIETADATNAPSLIEIIGINGTVLLRSVLTNTHNTISVTTLPKGLYLVRSNNGITITSAKFIKQ